MLTFIAKRLIHACFVLVVITIVVFLLIYLSGDPVALLAPLDARPEDVENIKIQFGLDKPIPVQYLNFVRDAVRGDFGMSFKYRRPVAQLVMQRLPATMTLAFTSLAVAVAIAIPLGSLSAARRGGLLDQLGTVFAFFVISIPPFWLGIILIMLFADIYRWFPASGRGTLMHLVLPTIAMCAHSVGLTTRLVRTTMADVMSEMYISVARAKGLSERVVLYKHALKNSLIPTVTVVGLQLGAFLGGSVVVESVFAWPGVGWLMYQGISSRDIPLVRTVVLVVGIMFVLINLVVDVLYCYLDPKIKYQ